MDASRVLVNGQGIQVQFTTMEQEVNKVVEKTNSLSSTIDTITDSVSLYTGEFTSDSGTIFDKSSDITTAVLTAHVYFGKTEVGQSAYTVEWFQRKDNGAWQQFSSEPAVTINLSEFQTSDDIYFEFEVLEKHNSIIERTYILEEKIRVANHRIDDLEEKVE